MARWRIHAAPSAAWTIQTEEIAEMVAYLHGPNSDNVTGDVLNNDGASNARMKGLLPG